MPSAFVPVYSADRALRAVQDRVQRASTSPVQSPALRTESFDAAAGATYRVRPTTTALLEARLPKAEAANYGKVITLIVDRPTSAFRVSCPTGTVNAVSGLILSLTGEYAFTSDGDGGWHSTPLDVARAEAVATANVAATNAVTDLTCITKTLLPNVLEVGSLYRLTGWFVYVHTAAATPTLTAEFLQNGAVIESVVCTPLSTAATYNGKIEAVFSCRTTGTGGTAKTDMMFFSSVGAAVVNALLGNRNTATNAIDTTVANTLELRVRMTTAVAANTLTVTQGYEERLA